jgi:hypothetical protein
MCLYAQFRDTITGWKSKGLYLKFIEGFGTSEQATPEKGPRRKKPEHPSAAPAFMPVAAPDPTAFAALDPPAEKKKRPTNAYMLFCQEQRPKLATTATSRGGTTLLADMWKAMTHMEKRPYFEKYEASKTL